MQLGLGAARDGRGPRAVVAVGLGAHAELRRGLAAVHHLEVDVAVGDVVAHAQLGHGRAAGAQCAEVALEMAVVAVGAEHPEVVAAGVVGGRVPAVVERLAGFDHVAARQAVEVEAVVDMEHGGRVAGVGEQQLQRAAGRVGPGAGVQLVGQRARGPRARGLARQQAVGRRRDLRQRLLRGAQLVGLGLGAAARERGQRLAVGIGEVEGAREVAVDRAAERADVAFLHAEAGLDEAQHRGVVEGLRVDPAASAPGRDHVHRHAHAGAVDVAVGRGLRLRHARRLGMVEVLEAQVRVGHRGLAREGLHRGIGRCDGRGRRGRGHVVEVAVVLVEVHEQHGLAPDLGHGGERLQHLLDVPRALHRARGTGVLGVDVGRDHPRHRRQPAGLHVGAEGIHDRARVEGRLVGHRQRVGRALVERVAGVVAGRVGRRCALRQRGADRLGRGLVGLAEVLEAQQRIAAVVVRDVLVDHPAHARVLQALGIGLPFVALGRGTGRAPGIDVVHVGHVAARGAVGAGPVERAVGVRAGVHRAVVVVADREGVGQRELERQLGLGEVAHRLHVGRGAADLLVARPLVEAAAVPGVVRVDPGVRRAAHALRIAFAAVEVIGQHHLAVLVELLPHVEPVGQRDREAVAEAAHALQRAEVVVERTVLLHQDHDVLDVLDGAGLVVGGNRERAADGRRKGRERERGGAGGGGAGEEFAA